MGLKSVLLLFLVTLVAVYGATVDTSTKIFPGVLRDQAPDTMCAACSPDPSCGTANGGKGFKGTDFEITLGTYQNGEKGIVGAQCDAGNSWKNCGQIGDDRTPIYAYTNPPRGSPGNNTRSPDSFYTWFHNTNQTIPVNYNITLFPAAGNTYQYTNNSFFPLDGKGWNDHCDHHNFAYCFEGHSRFGFQGGEVFSFTGDDDVWVYINNMLVIDLGALHQAMSMSVNLDDIQPPLIEGANYLIDFFYCERHTTESQMQLTTSIGLYCAYTDWCGVCEGTGLSCCTTAALKLCDDGDPCTIDNCGKLAPPPGGCNHTQIVCTPTDICHQSVCANGTCVQTPLNCDDGKACTTDSCDLSSGCKHVPVTCNDNSLCTSDACDTTTGKCVYTTLPCNGTDACTNYTCTPSTGCQSIAITKCNADNKCLPQTCTDHVNGCSSTPITCPPRPCQTVTCNPSVGCVYTNATPCDDGKACTTDTCDSVTGNCVFTPVVCPDNGDPCTNNVCTEPLGCQKLAVTCPAKDCQDVVCITNVGCHYTNRSCSDGLACTQDICTGNTCLNPPVVCTPADACHTSVCNNKTGGCDVATISCDDHNNCTKDSCDPVSGCVNQLITCDDGLTCTTDVCVAPTGCQYTPISCPLDSTLCNCVNGACVENTGCDDHDGCTIDSCTTGSGCSYANKSCDDGNICTVDTCLHPSGNCSNVNGDVTSICGPAPNQCYSYKCSKDQGGCYLTPKSCDDGDVCTTDICVNATGQCQHLSIAANCLPCGGKACPYSDLCNPATCNNVTLQCETSKKSCDDGSLCTNDFCNSTDGSCYYTAVTCTTTNLCDPQTCTDTAVGCQSHPVDCNDNNPCTLENCMITADGLNATCNRSSVICPVSNFCTETASCNSATGQCDITPITTDCDDNNNCTVDSCDPTNSDPATKCSWVPVTCSSDPCNPEKCNPSNGQCESTIDPCDDGNPCTIDQNVCVPGVGVSCQSTRNLSLCDDNNLCTDDTCLSDSTNASNLCSNVPRTCTADACHISLGCDIGTGNCTVVPKDCENNTVDWCSPWSCDPNVGCIEIPRNCPNKDIGCYVASCVSNGSTNGTCELNRVSNWSKAKGKNGVLCPLLYDDAAKAAAIAGGAVAGIVIGAVAAAGLIGFGGKKGYDYLMAKNSPIGDVGNNPLYAPSGGSGENPLFKS